MNLSEKGIENMNHPIKNVAIVGGTHGNELTGIYLIKKWQSQPEGLERNTFQSTVYFANPQAHQINRRYVDVDLNRQFTHTILENPELTNYEESRAKLINQELGPKGDPKMDLVVDIHNTTSNMGPTLILMQVDFFNIKLAAYLKEKMPEVNVLFENHIPLAEHAFLCSIGRQGIIIEVGPQPQSVLRQDILISTEQMIIHLLDFVEAYNQDALPILPDQIEAYQYVETIHYPDDESHKMPAVIHRDLQDNDFQPLNFGSPLFEYPNGETICWQGEYIPYPHFINEAAYYSTGAAMSMARQVMLKVEDA